MAIEVDSARAVLALRDGLRGRPDSVAAGSATLNTFPNLAKDPVGHPRVALNLDYPEGRALGQVVDADVLPDVEVPYPVYLGGRLDLNLGVRPEGRCAQVFQSSNDFTSNSDR